MYAETDSSNIGSEPNCIWCDKPFDAKEVEITPVCPRCVSNLRGIGLTNREIFEPEFLKKKGDEMKD